VDGALALWVVFWLVIGGLTAVSVWDLSGMGTTLSRSGQALDTAGEGLQRLGAVPLVGDRTEQLGNEVRATAADVTEQGRETRNSLRRLSILLGLAVALIPSAPVLGLYLPRRLARRRTVREVAARLRRRPDDPALDRYLAAQAVATLPLPRLLEHCDDPCGELTGGRARALADAELAHLGLRR
jgi:hypothetical protein